MARLHHSVYEIRQPDLFCVNDGARGMIEIGITTCTMYMYIYMFKQLLYFRRWYNQSKRNHYCMGQADWTATLQCYRYLYTPETLHVRLEANS